MPKYKQTYKQKFRKQWLQEEVCKEWIVEPKNDETSAYCKYCMSPVKAKFYDIQCHAKSKKHIANSEPFSSCRQLKVDFNKVVRNRNVVTAEALRFNQHSHLNYPIQLLQVSCKCI